jgi:hypothetical protein
MRLQSVLSRRKTCWSIPCGAALPLGRALESTCNMCQKIFDRHKKSLTQMTIPRASGAKNRRAGENRKIIANVRSRLRDNWAYLAASRRSTKR